MSGLGETGDTRLDPDAAAELIPDDVGNREELDTLELLNIAKCEAWAFSTRHKDLLSPGFVRRLHRRMFDETWRWAGRYRVTEKNIGIDPAQIVEAVHRLCEDVKTQLAGGVLSVDEIAARMFHRLVFIHPFPNGNGRHARMMADLLLVRNGKPRFTWGKLTPSGDEEMRQRQMDAVRRADAGDFAPLLAFARS